MAKELWIFAEQNDGVIASSYYEMLSEIKAVYAKAPEQPCFTAVTMGKDSAAVEELKTSGADQVISVVDDKLAAYNPAYYTTALCELAVQRKPDTILIAASAVGSELAPSVGARLDTGLVAHCTEIRLDDEGVLHLIVPAFGGKLMGENIVPSARPVMASIKPGVFERAELPAVADVNVIEFHPTSLAELQPGIELVDHSVTETSELPIEKAEIIVCAGLGAAISGNFEKVQELAKLLGASLGYTRPLCDLGYVPNEVSMIGTSGKTVKPKLYIGFGNSGSSHHICGIKDSGLIINVNSDEGADCFDISNYKVVADCGPLLDELLNQLKS